MRSLNRSMHYVEVMLPSTTSNGNITRALNMLMQKQEQEQEPPQRELFPSNLAGQYNQSVKLGSVVMVQWNGVTRKFTLVTGSNADSNSGKVAYDSPMGNALMGKRAGEVVAVRGYKDSCGLILDVF